MSHARWYRNSSIDIEFFLRFYVLWLHEIVIDHFPFWIIYIRDINDHMRYSSTNPSLFWGTQHKMNAALVVKINVPWRSTWFSTTNTRVKMQPFPASASSGD